MCKPSQITVSSPALYLGEYDGWWKGRNANSSYCCAEPLRNRFDIPATAKRLWIEASRTQWPDRSGLRCRICLVLPHRSRCQDEFGTVLLLEAPGRDLERGLGMQSGKPATIFICVWYEE